jgi:hypothetical protein
MVKRSRRLALLDGDLRARMVPRRATAKGAPGWRLERRWLVHRCSTEETGIVDSAAHAAKRNGRLCACAICVSGAELGGNRRRLHARRRTLRMGSMKCVSPGNNNEPEAHLRRTKR